MLWLLYIYIYHILGMYFTTDYGFWSSPQPIPPWIRHHSSHQHLDRCVWGREVTNPKIGEDLLGNDGYLAYDSEHILIIIYIYIILWYCRFTTSYLPTNYVCCTWYHVNPGWIYSEHVSNRFRHQHKRISKLSKRNNTWKVDSNLFFRGVLQYDSTANLLTSSIIPIDESHNPPWKYST